MEALARVEYRLVPVMVRVSPPGAGSPEAGVKESPETDGATAATRRYTSGLEARMAKGAWETVAPPATTVIVCNTCSDACAGCASAAGTAQRSSVLETNTAGVVSKTEAAPGGS